MTFNIAPPMHKKTELYDPAQSRVIPDGMTLDYHGGVLLAHVEVTVIFLGDWWNSHRDLATQLDAFWNTVMQSSVVGQLQEYSIGTYTLGSGSYLGSHIFALTPPATANDAWIVATLQDILSHGTIGSPQENSLYMIYLPSGVASEQGGDRSCDVYCGYHNNANTLYYAVIPYPDCYGCTGNLDVFQALCVTSSHELCEAVTDPAVGNGWLSSDGAEIGDICAWQFRQEGPYTVQKEWSNIKKTCI